MHFVALYDDLVGDLLQRCGVDAAADTLDGLLEPRLPFVFLGVAGRVGRGGDWGDIRITSTARGGMCPLSVIGPDLRR
jgi:hypothetical protein